MENFIVSARKYRPSRFEDVIGQPQVSGTLKNAIRNNQLAQAFLFCGPRGVGKTTCARILAKAVNCENLSADFEPCNTCPSCQSFNENASFNIFELDAASNNSVEDIRSLIEQVRFAPQAGKKKIYIIDEVHMLSQQAFNAFLKTLEEPPAYAIFILATTEKHKILPTILSRCQIFDFARIKTDDMIRHLQSIALKENITADVDALHIIAQKSDGALRDALSMFDRIGIFSNGKISYLDVVENLNILDYEYFFRITDFCLSSDATSALMTFDNILQKGFDGENFLSGLADHLREILVAKDPVTHVLLDYSENIKLRYIEQSKIAPASFLLSALNVVNEAEQQYRTSKNKRLTVEFALLKLCNLRNVTTVLKELGGLKKKSLTEAETLSAQVKEQPPLPNIPKKSVAEQSKNERVMPPLELSGSVKLPSMADLKKEAIKKKKQDEEVQEIVYEKIESIAFQQVWKNFMEKIADEGKKYLISILQSFPPELTPDSAIVFKVGNDSYLRTLIDEKEEMYCYLKKELDKSAIDLRIELDKSKIRINTDQKPYTSKEKYESLLKKNPKLKDLKERLKLDLDY